MKFGEYYTLENVMIIGCYNLENVIRYKKAGEMYVGIKKKNI